MRRFTIILLVSCTIFLVAGSVQDTKSLRIRLRWVPSYEKETWNDVRTGLAWSLSYLGAGLPKGSMDSAIVRIDTNLFELDLGKVGFTPEACKVLSVIVDSLKSSEEYTRHESIDLGRFLVLTLHSSWHYYAITGVKKTFREFRAAYNLESAVLEYPVLNSGVAHHHRRIHFNPETDASKMAFVAEESEGSLTDDSFRPRAYETFDVMANGQLRFAIYDEQGFLMAASPDTFGIAGKPSKCLWCHESSVLPLFVEPKDMPGRMSAKTFIEYVTKSQKYLNAFRSKLEMDIDYTHIRDHTLAELLYIGFMEPSPERMAMEWKMLGSTVTSRTTGLPKHIYEEFPFLGELFYRRSADSLAPYATVRVPLSVREMNVYEPDFTGLSLVRSK